MECLKYPHGVALGLALALAPSAAFGEDFGAVPVGRIAVGPGVLLDPGEAQVTADITGGVTGYTDFGLMMNVEAGYSFEERGLHAGNFTAGIGAGAPLLGVTFQPRLIVGALDGDLVLGMRNSVVGHAFYDILSVELGYQFLVDRDLEQDLRVGVGINVASAIFVVVRAIQGDDPVNL